MRAIDLEWYEVEPFEEFAQDGDGVWSVRGPRDRRLSGPIWAESVPPTNARAEWLVRIVFLDLRGDQRELVVPRGDLAGDGETIREELLMRGADLAPSDEDWAELLRYLRDCATSLPAKATA